VIAEGLTPILNVSDVAASIAWFGKLGWKKIWDWGEPLSFAGVGSGACAIYLCRDGQGGRGHGGKPATFGPGGDERADQGVWMMLWVDDVDAAHAECVAAGIEVTFAPKDMPWGVREMHIRHPDGHVFRVGHGIGED